MKRLLLVCLLALAIWCARAMMSGSLTFGIVTFDPELLERRRAEGRPVKATVVGIADIPPTVTPEQAREGIGRLRVVGLLQARKDVQSALAGRVMVTGTMMDPS